MRMQHFKDTEFLEYYDRHRNRLHIYIYTCIIYRIRKIKRRRCEDRRNVGSRVEYYTVLHLTCPIIPRNAHVLNVLSGTLTRYSWKKALMKNTVTDAVFFL